jgi:hypothetical protein
MIPEAHARPESLLRNRNFMLLAGARVSSSLATFMQSVAVGWLMYDLTGDPLERDCIRRKRILHWRCIWRIRLA